MKNTAFLRPCALGLVLTLAVPLAWSQSGTHRMVDPGKLTWTPTAT